MVNLYAHVYASRADIVHSMLAQAHCRDCASLEYVSELYPDNRCEDCHSLAELDAWEFANAS